MDTDLLVEQKDGGKRIVRELLGQGFDVSVAFWARTSDSGLWNLYIGSESVDLKDVAESYRKVYAAIVKTAATWIAPSDVKLLHASDPISVAAALLLIQNPEEGGVYSNGRSLANLPVDAVFVYPKQRWYKGFEEVLRQFPSAEMLAIPIMANNSAIVNTTPLTGQINACEFEGCAPGTLFYVGIDGKAGRAIWEMLFVHRPEGWNTLFRPDTKTWEEVVHVKTGERLYRSADFMPLLALKTEVKPAEKELEMIKKGLATRDYYMLIPGDPNPIYSIPYYPTAMSENRPAEVVDWERVRQIMEAGGRVRLYRSSKSMTG
jgi:hypothetical protein